MDTVTRHVLVCWSELKTMSFHTCSSTVPWVGPVECSVTKTITVEPKGTDIWLPETAPDKNRPCT